MSKYVDKLIAQLADNLMKEVEMPIFNLLGPSKYPDAINKLAKILTLAVKIVDLGDVTEQ